LLFVRTDSNGSKQEQFSNVLRYLHQRDLEKGKKHRNSSGSSDRSNRSRSENDTPKKIFESGYISDLSKCDLSGSDVNKSATATQRNSTSSNATKQEDQFCSFNLDELQKIGYLEDDALSKTTNKIVSSKDFDRAFFKDFDLDRFRKDSDEVNNLISDRGRNLNFLMSDMKNQSSGSFVAMQQASSSTEIPRLREYSRHKDKGKNNFTGESSSSGMGNITEGSNENKNTTSDTGNNTSPHNTGTQNTNSNQNSGLDQNSSQHSRNVHSAETTSADPLSLHQTSASAKTTNDEPSSLSNIPSNKSSVL